MGSPFKINTEVYCVKSTGIKISFSLEHDTFVPPLGPLHVIPNTGEKMWINLSPMRVGGKITEVYPGEKFIGYTVNC